MENRGMCEICDGKTHEEVLTGVHERIQRFGFTMFGVEPDPDHPPWLYTIGLVEHHQHPELCVIGIPVQSGFRLLDTLSHGVLAGDRFEPGHTVMAGDTLFHVQEVDSRLWQGDMFNQWKEYYAWRGDPVPAQSAVELVLCGGHPGVMAVLDAPYWNSSN
jgi:hypothetical protein